MTSAICGYDLTIACGDGVYEEIRRFAAEACKHWAFQKEKGEGGYEHFQCRVSLGVRRRLIELVDMAKKEYPLLKWHVSPTVKENCLPAKAFYVMKPDTRVEGPWTSEDEEETYVPRQIRDITLREWQGDIVADADVWNTRNINYVHECEGDKGKSILATYCGVHKIGRMLPPLNDYKDVMRIVMDMPTSKLYLVDMPRAIDQTKNQNFYAALEEIKSGHAWDDRYSYKEKYFDCPNIWVFGNTMPNMKLLSADRWRIWNIVDEKLVQVNMNKKQKIDE